MSFLNRYLKYLNESEEKIRTSVKGICILDDKKILILRIQNDCGGEGKWDLPGGGIEDNESDEDALKREVKEETNLHIVPGSIKSLNITKTFSIPESGVKARWKFYKCDVTNGNIVLNPSHWKKLKGQSEHNEAKWISDPAELDNIQMADEMKTVLKKELIRLWNKNPINSSKSFF